MAPGPRRERRLMVIPRSSFRVLVAGGGIAGIEGLLALRDLAGDRVELTLVTPDERFRLRPFAVAEPFGLGRPREVPHGRIARDVGAEWVQDSIAEVDDAARELRSAGGLSLGFDALLIAVGGREVDAFEPAMTWRPERAGEMFSGLLRDIEGGRASRVGFVVPAGAVWPLPAYELALMTARRANAVGMQAEITIVTPEREPLVFFGREASAALASALAAAGVRLIAGVAARVERRPRLHLVTGPDETVAVDRVVAMPVLHGPAVRGVPRDELGFIVTDTDGRAEGCQRTWAAGDGVASPLKLGGLATHQARRAARAIAGYAGVETTPTDDDGELVLDGVLMTGAAPVALDDRPLEPTSDAPLWWPSRKVAGRYLHAYLQDKERSAAQPRPQAGVRVRLDAATARELETGSLYSPSRFPSADEIARLGRRIHDYKRDHP